MRSNLVNPHLRFVLGLIKASHFGPTVLVVVISFILSLTQLSFLGAIEVACAIFAGQLVVGWTNDLLDFPLDKGAERARKPLIAGEVSISGIKKSIPMALGIALVLSLMGPLGLKGTAIHFLGILSATFYNFRLKRTVVSVVPYMVSFGAMPWAIYIAVGKTPPAWLYLGFIFFASAFHFLNVLKDLEADISQEIFGLPQRLGRRASIVIACVLVSFGTLATLIR